MRYLSLLEILELHHAIIESSGGSHGIRDMKALESAVNQPLLTFNQSDLYPELISKSVALGYSLIMNHPFVDGNKRTGQAAMETFLILNGYEIEADIDEQERVIIELADGKLTRQDFVSWVKDHTIPTSPLE